MERIRLDAGEVQYTDAEWALLLEENRLLREKLERSQAEAKNLKVRAENLEMTNEELKARIAQLTNELYGKKSERQIREDFPVADEPQVTEQEAAEIQEAEQEIREASAKPREKPKRKALPSEFERTTVVHDIPEDQRRCRHCGGALHSIGEEVSEKLELVPARIKIIRQVRQKYGCRGCETGISMAPGFPDFLPKSLAAPGLLAQIILSKYEYALPLYRQERMWQRVGVDIPRATLCNWILLAAE